MNLRIEDDQERTKVWLPYPSGIDALEEQARKQDLQRAVAILLMEKVGCRASGVQSATPAGLNYNDEGDYWELELQGKNTKGGEKKTRDAYVPDTVKRTLDIYESERDLEPDEPYVDVSVSTIRRWVRETAELMYESTENERWLSVSSHDLRRSWATHHLVEEDISVRVMMEIGGWNSYQAIEPYLAKPTSETIGEELAQVSR